MFYVMETIQKARYLLNEREKQEVYEAIAEHESHVIIQGDMIPLAATPSIMSFSRWWAKENERLAVSGKRLCKKCMKVMEMQDKCICWDSNLAKKQDAFVALPEEVSRILHSKVRSFPKLTTQDKLELEQQDQLRLTAPDYVEQTGGLGYRDKESGEIFFS